MEQIIDVYGFRIIVDEPRECYQVLGLVHELYKPIMGKFKDYIAIPRVNGYQSIHTSLLGPNGTPIEIQIRTLEMDRVAEMELRRTGSIKLRILRTQQHKIKPGNGLQQFRRSKAQAMLKNF